MADLTLLDTEFRKWSPTFVDAGHNPTNSPPGAQIVYTTDNASVLLLSFTPPTAHPELPTLAADGSEGVYVGSGAVGVAAVSATPGGSIGGFPPSSASVEVIATAASSMNMTFGDASNEE